MGGCGGGCVDFFRKHVGYVKARTFDGNATPEGDEENNASETTVIYGLPPTEKDFELSANFSRFPVVVVDDINEEFVHKGPMYNVYANLLKRAFEAKVVVFFITQSPYIGYLLWILNQGVKIRPMACIAETVDGIKSSTQNKPFDSPTWCERVTNRITAEFAQDVCDRAEAIPNFAFVGFHEAFKVEDYLVLLKNAFGAIEESKLRTYATRIVDGDIKLGDVVTYLHNKESILELRMTSSTKGQVPYTMRCKVQRTGACLETFYSLDGQTYVQMRQAYLTTTSTLEVSMVAAASTGPGFVVTFEEFTIRPSR